MMIHRSHNKLKIEFKIKCCVWTDFRSHRKLKTKIGKSNVWIRFSMPFLSYYILFYFILIFESLQSLFVCISICTLLVMIKTRRLKNVKTVRTLLYHFLANSLAHNTKMSDKSVFLHNYPQSPVFGLAVSETEVKFHFFDSSKHGEGKLLSNIFCFAILTCTIILWRFYQARKLSYTL